MVEQIKKIKARIAGLKFKLQLTNDKAIQYAVGEITAEEYAETSALRKSLREEINALEAELQALRAKNSEE